MRKKDDDSVLSIRLPAEDADRLQRDARSRGVTVSRLARERIASGSRPAPVAPLSYGIAGQQPGVTLTVSSFGAMAPEASTGGTSGVKVEQVRIIGGKIHCMNMDRS